MASEQRHSYDRFLQLAIDQNRGPLLIMPTYQFATDVQTDKDRNRKSGNWVRNRVPKKAIAMTLKTAGNAPHSTAEDDRAVGTGHARMVA